MLRTLLIDEKKIDRLFVGDGFEIPSFPMEIIKKEVNGRTGAVFGGKKVNPITIEVPLIYRNKFNPKRYKEILDEIVRFTQNGDEVSIRFSEEDWYWFGRVTGPINFEMDVTAFATFKLTIELLDPFKYSIQDFENVAVSDQITVRNTGTAETYPVFEATALKDSTHIMITKANKDYIMIGEPPSANKTVKKVNPNVLNDRLESTSGWYYITSDGNSFGDRETGGLLGGNIKSNGYGFYVDPKSYPTTTKAWVGAGVKKSFSRNIQDFEHKFTVRVSDVNTTVNKLGTGKVFTHLWDEVGRLVASIGIMDASSSSNDLTVVAKLYDRAGEPDTIYTFKPSKDVYLDDFVHMSIKRVSNKWTFTTNTVQVLKMRTRKDKAKYGATREIIRNKHTETYTDKVKQYTTAIRTASIYIAKYNWGNANLDKNSSLFKAMAYGIYTNELNLKKPDETDLLIEAGDKILIDNFNQKMMINKKDMTKEKDFGSNYFSLPANSDTECFIEPPDTFQVTAMWKKTDY